MKIKYLKVSFVGTLTSLLYPVITWVFRGRKILTNTDTFRTHPYLDTSLSLPHSLVCTGTVPLVQPTLHLQCSGCVAALHWWSFPHTLHSLPSVPDSHPQQRSQGMMQGSWQWLSRIYSTPSQREEPRKHRCLEKPSRSLFGTGFPPLWYQCWCVILFCWSHQVLWWQLSWTVPCEMQCPHLRLTPSWRGWRFLCRSVRNRRKSCSHVR